MSSRRNVLIRAIASLTGDLAIGTAVASACAWIVQAAAASVFINFLFWVLGFIAWLTLSQYVLHPAVSVLLSDKKLDQGVMATVKTARSVVVAAGTVWELAQRHAADLRYFAKPF